MTGDRHRCPSRLALERYLLGELDDGERLVLERGIATCQDCAAALDELRADDAAFVLHPVPPALRELWTAPARRRVPWLRVGALAAPLVAAAAVLLVLLATPLGGPRENDPGDGPPGIGDRAGSGRVRGKGPVAITDGGSGGPSGLALGFYLLEGEGRPVLGRPGQVLRQGDRIQFWYHGAADGAAVLVGIDGRRQVTRYLPGRGEAEPLPPGDGHLLESAILLDDAKGTERFFLCVGRDVSAARVEAAARELAAGPEPTATERLALDCDQATVWIVKE
jgi:hypothetical protein